MPSTLTPRQVVAELDTYIIGQTEAKKSVAIALRNRWRRQNAPPEMRDEIMPNNIILIGPTGVGKTEIARRLARLAGAPFIKVEATKFTEVGYVGRDVESMIRDLMDIAIGLIRDEQTEQVQARAQELAEERVLDLLVPPSTPTPSSQTGFDLATNTDAPPPNKTRERFREKMHAGELDDREVEVEVDGGGGAMMQVFGPGGLEEMGVNIQDLFGGKNKKRKKRRVKVPEALELLTKEEAGKLIDMDTVTREALERVQQSGIVFIDEIDKVAGGNKNSGGGGGPDVSREGVQRDLLPIVEGSTVTTKHGLVKTDHILFIASGAFHVAKPSDLIPELQGRFPIRVELNSLTEEDFFAILTQPKNALLKQYAALMQTEGVTLTFTDDAVKEIAAIAARVNAEVENIGARRLHTILTTLLEDYLYELPDAILNGEMASEIEVTAKQVRDHLHDIVEDRDLSQYIL